MMPEGMEFTEARVRFDPGDELVVRFLKGPLLNEVGDVLKRFDWHSQPGNGFLCTGRWNSCLESLKAYGQCLFGVY